MIKLNYVIIVFMFFMTFSLTAKDIKRAKKFELKKIGDQQIPSSYPANSGNEKFSVIKNFDAELEKVSSTIEFDAGSDPEITFRLINLSFKKLKIREWMMKESDNIILYYTPKLKNMSKPPALDKWMILKPEISKKTKRMPLELKHRNSVLISTHLSFIKNLNNKKNSDFYIMAKLNLKSLPLKSRVLQIRVNPSFRKP
jgi:hypothetical protein